MKETLPYESGSVFVVPSVPSLYEKVLNGRYARRKQDAYEIDITKNQDEDEQEKRDNKKEGLKIYLLSCVL